MRRIARTDANQQDIVDALRRMGCSVTPTHQIGKGFPDLAVGVRGLTLLFEVKDGLLPTSRQALTPDELQWHSEWRGHVQVINSVDHAIRTINHYRRQG